MLSVINKFFCIDYTMQDLHIWIWKFFGLLTEQIWESYCVNYLKKSVDMYHCKLFKGISMSIDSKDFKAMKF